MKNWIELNWQILKKESVYIFHMIILFSVDQLKRTVPNEMEDIIEFL